jgi:hypothetical protein
MTDVRTNPLDRPGTAGTDGGWEAAIRTLAAMERPSASGGEQMAAEWIAARLRELGWRAEIEQEQAHGGYWWPVGLANAIGAVAGALALRRRGRGSRFLAVGAAGGAAAPRWGDCCRTVRPSTSSPRPATQMASGPSCL